MAVFWLRKVPYENKPYEWNCWLFFALQILNIFRECLCYISKCSVLNRCLLTGVHVAKFKKQSNYCSRTFRVCFRTNSRMFITLRNVLAYSLRFSVLCSLTYRWEILMSVQVENFDNSHIQGSRACSHNFRECSRFSQRRYWLFYASRNLCSLHTNKSSSSVDTH